MPGRFTYKLLSKYPHMKPADVLVWEKFIKNHPDFFDRVDYDVHVGLGAEFLPSSEETPDGRQNRLYKRKIDVVGYRGKAVWIIEIKPEASPSALGQLLAYASLTEDDELLGKNRSLAVLCESCPIEMVTIYANNNIFVLTA